MDLFKTDLLRQHPRPRRAAYTERPRRPGCRSATTARPAPAALAAAVRLALAAPRLSAPVPAVDLPTAPARAA